MSERGYDLGFTISEETNRSALIVIAANLLNPISEPGIKQFVIRKSEIIPSRPTFSVFITMME
jgi:hypothetical protein